MSLMDEERLREEVREWTRIAASYEERLTAALAQLAAQAREVACLQTDLELTQAIVRASQIEIDGYRAEIAALHASRDEWTNTAVQRGLELEELRAEIAALREALMKTRGYISDKFDVVKALLTIDAALKGNGEGK